MKNIIGNIMWVFICLTIFIIMGSAGITSDDWQYWVIGLYIILSRISGMLVSF
jgi:hypothetical protein